MKDLPPKSEPVHLPNLKGITTRAELAAIIAQHPGVMIEHLGQIPKIPLLTHPERAYASPINSPTPHDVRTAKSIIGTNESSYHSVKDITMSPLLHAKAAYLWNERAAGRLQGTDDDIRLALRTNLDSIIKYIPKSIDELRATALNHPISRNQDDAWYGFVRYGGGFRNSRHPEFVDTTVAQIEPIQKRDAAIMTLHIVKRLQYGVPEVFEHYFEYTLDKIGLHSDTMQRRDIPKAVNMFFDTNPEFTRYPMLVPWLKSCITRAFKIEFHKKTPLESLTPFMYEVIRQMMIRKFPYDKVQQTIRDAVENDFQGLVTSHQSNPNVAKMVVALESTKLDELSRFDTEDALASHVILKRDDTNAPSRLTHAHEFANAHRKRPSKFVHLTEPIIENTQWSEDLNLRWANPALPSEEALVEIRNRGVLPTVETLPPELQPYWNAVQAMVSASHIDPQEWYSWALASKSPFASATAGFERKKNLGSILHNTKRFIYHESDSDVVRRFPSKSEQFDVLSFYGAPDASHRAHRAWGYKATRIGPVPFRAVRENHLSVKDTYTPTEALEIYRLTYNALSADYLRGGHPDSYAAAYHYSLYTILGGNHNQEYKGRGPTDFHGSQTFDELDALLFLPGIARDNGNPPAMLALGMRLYFQMDDNFKALYAPEIAESFKQLSQQIPQVDQLLFYTRHHDPTTTLTPDELKQQIWSQHVPSLNGLALNIADTNDAQDANLKQSLQLYENGKTQEFRYDTSPNLVIVHRRGDETYRRFNDSPPTEVDIRNGSYQVVNAAIIKEAQALLQTKFKTNEGSRDFKTQGRNEYLRIQDSILEVMGLDPDAWSVESFDVKQEDFPSIPVLRWDWDMPWVDMEVDIGPDGRLVDTQHEIILPPVVSAEQRFHRSDPKLRELLDPILTDAGQNHLGHLFTAADIMHILAGVDVPPDAPALQLAQVDTFIRYALELRGASAEDVRTMLSKLNEPLPFEEMSTEGIIQLLWTAGGLLERPAIAERILHGVGAAARISVYRLFEQVENFHRKQLLTTYEQDLGLSQDEALAIVGTNPVVFRFRELRDELGDELARRTQVPRLGNDQEQQFSSMLTPENNLIMTQVREVMKDLSRVTDYNYSSTQYLQLMHQLFADGGADYMDSNGRLQMYCVQTAHILLEMLEDTLLPVHDIAWAKPLELSVALEDEKFGITLNEYFQNCTDQSLGLADSRDSFNHYFILVGLPTKTLDEPRTYALIDATEGSIRLMPENAITQTSDHDMLISNTLASAHPVDETQPEPKKITDTSRLLVMSRLGDQSLPLVTMIMREPQTLDMTEGTSSTPLGKYAYTIDQIHPMTHRDAALDTDNDILTRRLALQSLLRTAPYFIGEQFFFRQPKDYLKTVTDLMELSLTTDEPLIGMFLTRTYMATTLSKGIHPLLKAFRTICATVPDEEWQRKQESIPEGIFHPDDQTWIEQERERLRSMTQEEVQELRQETVRQAAMDISTVHEKIKATPDTQSFLEFLKDMMNIAPEAGSSERAKRLMHDIGRHAEILRRKYEIPVLAPTTHDPNSSAIVPMGHKNVRIIPPPIPLQPVMSVQAAHLLLHGATAETVQSRLLQLSAFTRAFILDNRSAFSKPEDMRSLWQQLNESVQRAARERNLELPTKIPLNVLAGGDTLEAAFNALKRASRNTIVASLRSTDSTGARSQLEDISEHPDSAIIPYSPRPSED